MENFYQLLIKPNNLPINTGKENHIEVKVSPWSI